MEDDQDWDGRGSEEGEGARDWDDDSEGEPSFGEDILSLRQRAARLLLARTGKAEPADPKGADPAGPATVDLNQLEAVARLEDPGLVAHMNSRRAQAARSEAEAAALPDLSRLRQDDAKVRQAFSAVMVAYKDRQMELRCAAEEIALAAENAVRLGSGEVPHGYPSGAPLEAQCRRLGEKLRATSSSLSALMGEFDRLGADLTLARRGHDLASTGLLRLAEAAPGSGPPE
jgi:hypothetical protein